MFLLFEMNGRWEKWNVFLKSLKCCFISLKQGAISSADFRRIKPVHCFFLRVMQYIVTMRRREILFNFWLAENLQKH